MLYYFSTYIFDFVLYFSCLNGCVGWQLCCRLWAWNGLPLNIYSSTYARTNKCYNERGSRTNYVRSNPTVRPNSEVLETHPPFDHSVSIRGSMNHTAIQQEYSPLVAEYQIGACVLSDI